MNELSRISERFGAGPAGGSTEHSTGHARIPEIGASQVDLAQPARRPSPLAVSASFDASGTQWCRAANAPPLALLTCSLYRAGDGSTTAYEELALERKVGSGGFSDVWKGVWRGQACAVKLLSARTGTPAEDAAALARLQAEAALNAGLSHKNVVKFKGACTAIPHLALVLEYIPDGCASAAAAGLLRRGVGVTGCVLGAW